MKLVNRTRTSPSIPRRLWREKPYLLPLYHLLRTSFLAREGMENSGSRHFADHIYLGQAKGHAGIGRLLDRVLLSLPAARSFRNRYANSRDRIAEDLSAEPMRARRVLSVPCGLPRDLAEIAGRFPRTTFIGLDADSAALEEARAFTSAIPNLEYTQGDALDAGSFPRMLDIITSSGLAEFLSDEQLVRFYGLCYDALEPAGLLISSATLRNQFTDYLLRELAELQTNYRDEDALAKIFAQTPFVNPRFVRDPGGYQVLIQARK